MNHEIVLKTHELKIEESANICSVNWNKMVFWLVRPRLDLEECQIRMVIKSLIRMSPDHLKEMRRQKAETLPKVLITDIDLNWL